MYIDCESVNSSSSAVKQTSETLQKKLIRYLCFISVGFIQSCHHSLKKGNFSLEKNRLRSIDLTCWPADQQTTTFTILNYLAYEFLKGFLVQERQQSFENSPAFQISWTYSDVLKINGKFIHNCPPCLLAEMAKVAS